MKKKRKQIKNKTNRKEINEKRKDKNLRYNRRYRISKGNKGESESNARRENFSDPRDLFLIIPLTFDDASLDSRWLNKTPQLRTSYLDD